MDRYVLDKGGLPKKEISKKLVNEKNKGKKQSRKDHKTRDQQDCTFLTAFNFLEGCKMGGALSSIQI